MVSRVWSFLVIALSAAAATAQLNEATEFREVVRDAPIVFTAVPQAKENGVRPAALWSRLVDIDPDAFRERLDALQLLFSPIPDLTFFLRYQWHKDYGPGTSWHGEMVDSSGATVGYVSVVTSTDGYLRLEADAGLRKFVAVPLPNETFQVLYEVDRESPSETSNFRIDPHGADGPPPLTPERRRQLEDYWRNNEALNEARKEYEAYNQAINERVRARRLREQREPSESDGMADQQ